MKLINALKHSGRPFEIPDASRNDLPEFFLEMGFKVGAEIGVKEGEFSEIICRAGLKLYGIDPYLMYGDYVEPETYESLNQSMEKAAARLQGYDFTAIKKTSMSAVRDFTDESLDFVYIDGNHSFKFVAEDIFEWSKKVKPGGVIAGHDYVYMAHWQTHYVHARYVVDAYTKAFRINNWYVIGRGEKIDGEKRDRYRSWFWIKQ